MSEHALEPVVDDASRRQDASRSDALGDPLIDPLSVGAGGAGGAPGPGDGFNPMGDGRGGTGENSVVKSSTAFRGYRDLVGAKNVSTFYDGTTKGSATTSTRGSVTDTHTDKESTSAFGTKTKESVDARDSGDRKFAERDKTSTNVFGKTTTTHTNAAEDEDGYKNVTGTKSTTPKGGTTTTRDLTPKEEKKGSAKKATNEAGVEKLFAKGKGMTALSSLAPGSVGDESGIDLESFANLRENKAEVLAGHAGVTDIAGGKRASVSGFAGARASGGIMAESLDKDALGNNRYSRAAATGSAFVGAEGEMGAQYRTTESGHEAGANVSGTLGIGAEGVVGATSQTELVKHITAEAGAQSTRSGFAGVKGSGSVKASHGALSAKAGASAEVMAGAEVQTTVGGKAGVNAAGFDLAGVRADVDMKGLVGGKAGASGEVSANPLDVTAKGRAGAFAGAKVEGEASAGASLGGVDGDVVGKGEALAGADAKAAGEATVGVTGASAEGQASAFAGAKANGEARFEVGAGGLNLGLIGVKGEVSAGIGAFAAGNLSLSIKKVGISGQAGVTCGVGAGVGAMFNLDPSFPIRLTLNKLAENKVIPTSDIGDLIGAAASLVYKPIAGAISPELQEKADGAKAGPAAEMARPEPGRGVAPVEVGGPAQATPAPQQAPRRVEIDSAKPPALKVPEMAKDTPASTRAPEPEAAAPVDEGVAQVEPVGRPDRGLSTDVLMEEIAPGLEDADDGLPSEPTRLNVLLAKAPPKQREALEKAQGSVRTQLADTVPAVLGDMNAVVGAGGSFYSNMLSLMGKAFAASQEAAESAMAAGQELIQSGIAQAKAVGGEIGDFAKTVVASIQKLIATDPKTLLDGGWEKMIDDGVERVREFAAKLQARIDAIIERVRAALAELAKKAVQAAVAPVRSLIGSLGAAVGQFGGVVSDTGSRMIGRVRGVLGGLSKGVQVPGMPGLLTLPVDVSQSLDIAAKPVGDFGSFAQKSVQDGLNSAVDFISDGLQDVFGARSGGMLGALANAASFVSSTLIQAPVKMVEGAAAAAKPVIRFAVDLARRVIEAAKAAAEAAKKVVKAVEQTVKKVVDGVVDVAKKVGSAIASAATSFWNWLTGKKK
jgi:hypothetical protein